MLLVPPLVKALFRLRIGSLMMLLMVFAPTAKPCIVTAAPNTDAATLAAFIVK